MSDRARSDQVAESPLPNQGAAAATVTNKIDNVNPGFFKLGEFEPDRDAAKWRFFRWISLLDVCHQAVEADVRVDFFQLGPIKGFRVDLEYFHNQCTDILQVQIKLHRFIWRELCLVGKGEIEINSVFQLLKLSGRKLSGPLLGIT